MISSTMRPVPLRRRDDLVIQSVTFRDEVYAVVKDPLALKYFRLQPEQLTILEHLDGHRSLTDLQDIVQSVFPTVHITVTDVQNLVTGLHEKGLLTSERMRQGETMLKRHRESWLKSLSQNVMNPLFIKLPSWNPDNVLTKITPWVGWIFSKPGMIFLGLLICLSWLFVAVRFDEIRQRLPAFQQFFGFSNLGYLWLTLGITKILHEFGHGISCKYFGGRCYAMGVVLMVLNPTMYCDVTDSWMMKNKWHRIIIGAAGMYVEMLLAALAILIWYNTQPGVLNHVALNVFFVSTVTTVIFNANPLLRYDGYYMLADFLEIPNLNERATQALNQQFAWRVFGIEQPQDPFAPTSGRFWFILFVIASSLYRWFVLFMITIFLYTVLKPYRLQSLGAMLAFFSIAGVFFSLMRSLFKMLIAPRRDPLNRLKILFMMGLLIATGAGVMLVPVPWYEEAAFYVEPAEVQHVYAVLPGVVEEIGVIPDQQVERGQLLVRMHSPELLDQQEKLRIESEAQKIDLELYRELKDPEGLHLAQQRAAALSEQLQDVERQLLQLELKAPVAGRIVEPARTPQRPMEKTRQQLGTWHGTPLEARNLGATLEPATHICSVAPLPTYQAILLIRQGDRGDLQVGDKVRLKLDLFPGEVFEGCVKAFSDRELIYAPPALSSRHGGPLATVTDARGQERLNESVYQATVDFVSAPPALKSGMRGTGRFIVDKRTLWSWLWRAFRTTFHFRL